MPDRLMIASLLVCCVTPSLVHAQGPRPMEKRIKAASSAVVRILVDGKPSGTGFVVSNGLIATNFHVVQLATPAANGQTQVGYSPKIAVQFQGRPPVQAAPHPSVVGPGLAEAVGKDVALLSVPTPGIVPLKLGRFSDVHEGDPLYLFGYPLGVEQAIIARGMLSTKWKTDGYLSQGGQREVAWLDITMNGGNSGGPVLLMADDPAQDVVVGIANFNLNPFAQRAKAFAKVAADFPGNVVMMGIDFKQFSTLVGAALSAQSHGVGGCIAIDYVRLPKP